MRSPSPSLSRSGVLLRGVALVALFAAVPVAAQDRHAATSALAPAANRLIAAALADSAAWNRMALLADRFGPRLSGSVNLEHAIDWALAEMRRDGLENVHGERAMVPHWVRGAESATLLAPRAAPLHMLGLGGSVGTPAGGITADVLVVTSFDDLQRRAGEARGKIVLFDVPFTSYRETVRYRSAGASAAARVGAVASLIRSVASASIQSPHTGALRYDTTATRIPGAALSVEDAAMLHRMQDRGEHIRLHMEMSARTLPDAESRNVVAEIRGRELPDEVVIISGHLDSWDVGQGAMDDAGGSVAAWEAVRLMKQLGLRPRRTVRVVLWTNEENGTRGGQAYHDAHLAELPRHVAAIESDNGVFRPLGFHFTGSAAGLEQVRALGQLLAPIKADRIEPGGPEADVRAMVEAGVPGLGLTVDGSRYFDYHHSDGDTPDKLDPREMAASVASLAVMAYAIAEIPVSIAREAAPAATP